MVCLFILAIFSAGVFYIGWTQFRVRPDYIGVVVSKTDGVSDIPVENGKFSWHWQFLLPTNAELKLFNIKPLNVNKTVKGQLPSGEIYSSIYNTDDSFSYYFNFSISLTLSPEAIVELLKLNKISNNEDLQEYLSRAADTIAQLSADYYLKKTKDTPSFRLESVRRDDLIRDIQFYKDCPELDISTFALVESKVPDYSLYRKIQNGFLTDSYKSEDQLKNVDNSIESNKNNSVVSEFGVENSEYSETENIKDVYAY